MRDFLDILKTPCADVRTGELLAAHTTFHIGGPAKWFAKPTTEKELSELMRVAGESGIQVVCIGGGSNLLVSDDGVDGLVIVNAINHTVWQDDGYVTVGGGVIWDDFVVGAIERGFDGLTSGSGIPGTVGGAVFGNAGAYGESVSDNLVSAKLVGTSDDIDGAGPSLARIAEKKELQFDYRSSILRSTGEQVVEATFRLPQGDREAMRERRREILTLRHTKHPTVSEPTAGSFFKNIEAEPDRTRLHTELGIPDRGHRLAAGALLDRAGAGGMAVGDAVVSKRHANIVVNLGNASALDVLKLSWKLKKLAREQFGIELEREVRWLGGREPQESDL